MIVEKTRMIPARFSVWVCDKCGTEAEAPLDRLRPAGFLELHFFDTSKVIVCEPCLKAFVLSVSKPGVDANGSEVP